MITIDPGSTLCPRYKSPQATYLNLELKVTDCKIRASHIGVAATESAGRKYLLGKTRTGILAALPTPLPIHRFQDRANQSLFILMRVFIRFIGSLHTFIGSWYLGPSQRVMREDRGLVDDGL